jgi:hypothetical protein
MFKWKLNQEEGAFIWAIFDNYGALMFLDNTVCNRETKACSCTDFFCGKKWIKDTLFQSYWYTLASIGKMYINYVSLLCTSNITDIAH